MIDFKPCQFCSQPCQVTQNDNPFVKSEWYVCKKHPSEVAHVHSWDDNDIHVLAYWFYFKYGEHIWTFSYSTSKLSKDLSVWTFIGTDIEYVYKGPISSINPENALDKLQTMITFS